jgi:hypothetical protein
MIRRLEELRFIQVRFFKDPPQNYGIMTSIIQRFGMFFLQDLNPVTGELPVIAQTDDADVALKLTLRVKKVGKSRNPSGPHSEQPNTEGTIEYPLGERPTWNELLNCLDKDPMRIMHSPRWISLQKWDEYASDLFISFTNDMWLALDPSRLRNRLGTATTLQEAMESWSVSHVVDNLLSVRFLPNSHGLNKITKQCWDFSDLLDVFFPQVDELPPKAVWTRFSQRHGYLHTYSEYQATLSAKHFQDLNANLAELLGQAQCLPNSTQAGGSRHGRLWTGSHGTIDMRTNSTCYRLKGISSEKSKARKVARINLPSHQVITRLDEAQGISTKASKNRQRKEKRSAMSRNKRIPPHARDGVHDRV